MKKGNNKNTIINYIPFYVLGAEQGERETFAANLGFQVKMIFLGFVKGLLTAK